MTHASKVAKWSETIVIMQKVIKTRFVNNYGAYVRAKNKML